MFEKTSAPIRKGNQLTFKFNSEAEILAFQEVVGIGFFMYSIRDKPEFKDILNLVDQAMKRTGWKKYPV